MPPSGSVMRRRTGEPRDLVSHARRRGKTASRRRTPGTLGVTLGPRDRVVAVGALGSPRRARHLASPPSVQRAVRQGRGMGVQTRRLVAAVVGRLRRLVAAGVAMVDRTRLLVEAVVAAQVRPMVEAAASHLVVGAAPFPFVGRVVRRQLPLLLLPLLVAEAAVEAPLPTSLAGIRSLVTIRP